MEKNKNRQKMLETADKEHSEGKVRREKKKKKMMVTMGNLTLDDSDAKGKTKLIPYWWWVLSNWE